MSILLALCIFNSEFGFGKRLKGKGFFFPLSPAPFPQNPTSIGGDVALASLWETLAQKSRVGDKGDKGDKEDMGKTCHSLVLNAQCPMPNAQCPMPSTFWWIFHLNNQIGESL
jgi:hypothetical protein